MNQHRVRSPTSARVVRPTSPDYSWISSSDEGKRCVLTEVTEARHRDHGEVSVASSVHFVVTRFGNAMHEGIRELCVNFSYSYLHVLRS